nr:response regulator transcription factor [Oceanobacter mangrovi]
MIIDDHRMFADAMMNLFRQCWPAASVRCVNSANEGLQQLQQQAWQLLLMDLGLPDMDGLALLEQVRKQHSSLPLLVCTGETRPVVLKRVLQAGASGLITKNQSAEEVLQAIDAVLAGIRYLAPEAEQALSIPEPHQADVLSERQLAILRLMQAGHSTPEIARQLFLSPNTVKTHIRLMFEKLGVNNRVECLTVAHERGYIHV